MSYVSFEWYRHVSKTTGQVRVHRLMRGGDPRGLTWAILDTCREMPCYLNDLITTGPFRTKKEAMSQ